MESVNINAVITKIVKLSTEKCRDGVQLSLSLFVLSFSTSSFADCAEWIARIVSVQGNVEVRKQNTDKKNWQPVNLQQTYCLGDTFRVKNNSRAALELHNDTILRLDQNTTLVLSGPKKDVSWLDLLKGSLHSISRVPRSLKIKTPFVNAGVEGTEFLVSVKEDNTLVGVIEGKVLVDNEFGRVLLAKDQSAITYKGKAPVLRLDINPTDSVQWSLYYPSLNVVELKPAEDLIRVGQVEAAEKLLAGQSSAEALALRSIIAIARNKKDDAIKLAQQAIQTNNASVAAHLSHSYALQANFNLPEALAATQQAIKQDGQHAVAWARLAELQLSLSELDLGLASAKRAVELEPNLARTQTLLGFAYLLQYETSQAKQAFKRSIELDSADPLARLGNGLATIREGNLKQGRREIEIAASLDTNNAQIRSYLGKAYLEENRFEVAADQFILAKQMDPKDPTPWLYHAILKQSTNDPVGALRDLERSKTLNNNRIIFRSKQLLDEDEAVRSTSIARIYNVLGSEQLALKNAWDSVNSDHASASGHRFLADAYSHLPRHKIAEVSELLQAQLLQPLNSEPTQVNLLERDLGIQNTLGSSNSFGDYNSFFTREGAHVKLNTVLGSDNTIGEDLSLSGIHKSFAYSFGQYHYESDGFRENNQLEQNSYNAFVQAKINPSTSVQAEFRRVDSDFGDLLLNFDPANFSNNQDNKRRREIARIGGYHKLTPDSQLLFSIINNEYQINRLSSTSIPLTATITSRTDRSFSLDSSAQNVEIQYIHKRPTYNYVAGLGYFDEDRRDIDTEDITIIGLFPTPIVTPGVPDIDDIDTEYMNAYLYSHYNVEKNLMLTLGASYDDISSTGYNGDEFNPKLGIVWTRDSGIVLRAAYLEGVTRPINAEQSIEPTQVAGFNQIFDDVPGSTTKRYGVGIDKTVDSLLSTGFEVSWRKLESPFGTVRDMRDEQLHRAYITWHPDKSWVVNAEYFYDEQKGNVIFPQKLLTQSLPIGIRYFGEGGYFIGLTETYVDQQVNHTATAVSGEDKFWLADLSIGYRLPKRKGLFQIDVRNLFDKSFSFQARDNGSLVRGVISPRFVPERQIFVRFSYAF